MTHEATSRRPSGEEWQIIDEQRGELSARWRRIKHDKFGMRLNEDVVVNPDGTEGSQYWLDFYRQAVMIFPMDKKGNIYLGLEHAYATNEYLLEAGGGTPNAGESLEAAAVREVREELGVEVDRLQRIGVYGEITSRVRNQTYSYLARVKAVRDAHPETGEDISMEEMPFPVALELVRRGVITTGVVAASIWQINDMLNREHPISHRRRMGMSRLTGRTNREATIIQTRIQA